MPRTSTSLSTSASDGDFSSETSGGFDSLSSECPASPLSFGSHGADGFFHLVSPTLSTSELHPHHGYGIAMPSNASDGSSSACSSQSSPRLEYFDPHQEFPNGGSMNFDISELDAELSNLLPNSFEQVTEEGYAPNGRSQTDNDSTAWANQAGSAYGSTSSLYFQSQRHADQGFVHGFPDASRTFASRGYANDVELRRPSHPITAKFCTCRDCRLAASTLRVVDNFYVYYILTWSPARHVRAS